MPASFNNTTSSRNHFNHDYKKSVAEWADLELSEAGFLTNNTQYALQLVEECLNYNKASEASLHLQISKSPNFQIN